MGAFYLMHVGDLPIRAKMVKIAMLYFLLLRSWVEFVRALVANKRVVVLHSMRRHCIVHTVQWNDIGAVSFNDSRFKIQDFERFPYHYCRRQRQDAYYSTDTDIHSMTMCSNTRTYSLSLCLWQWWVWVYSSTLRDKRCHRRKKNPLAIENSRFWMRRSMKTSCHDLRNVCTKYSIDILAVHSAIS